MLQSARNLWAEYGPDEPSGELALMGAGFAVFVTLLGILLPVAVPYGGGVALGLWLAAHYSWLRGC